MIKTSQPALHGDQHLPDGSDPIPDLLVLPSGSYQEIVLAEPSLVGYWPLDEASGDALDASGHGYTLAICGTPIQGEPGPFTDPDDPTATLFDYTGSEPGGDGFPPAEDAFYRDDSDLNTVFVGSDGLSYECWVYPVANPSIEGGIVLCISGDWNHTGYQLRHLSDGKIEWKGPTVTVTSSAALPLDTWTHIAGTLSLTTGSHLYFDGGEVASGANQTPDGAASRFMIAAVTYSTLHVRHFQGRIAQAALFREALDAGTINSHYQGGVLSGAGDGAAGWVLTTDGAGNTSWAAPTVEVEY